MAEGAGPGAMMRNLLISLTASANIPAGGYHVDVPLCACGEQLFQNVNNVIFGSLVRKRPGIRTGFAEGPRNPAFGPDGRRLERLEYGQAAPNASNQMSSLLSRLAAGAAREYPSAKMSQWQPPSRSTIFFGQKTDVRAREAPLDRLQI